MGILRPLAMDVFNRNYFEAKEKHVSFYDGHLVMPNREILHAVFFCLAGLKSLILLDAQMSLSFLPG